MESTDIAHSTVTVQWRATLPNTRLPINISKEERRRWVPMLIDLLSQFNEAAYVLISLLNI